MAATGVAVGQGATLWAMLAPSAGLTASQEPATGRLRIIGPLIMSIQGQAAAAGSTAPEAAQPHQPLGAAAHIQLAAAAAAASSAAAAASASPLAQLGTPLRGRRPGSCGRTMTPSSMECLYEEGEALAALLSMSPAHRHLFVLEEEDEAAAKQAGGDPVRSDHTSKGSRWDTLMWELGGTSSEEHLEQELAASCAAETAEATAAVDAVNLADEAGAGSPAAAAATEAGAGAPHTSSKLRHRRSTSGSAASSGHRESLISPTPGLALTPRTTKRRRLAPRRLRAALAAAAEAGGGGAAAPSTLASSAAAAAAQCQQAAEEAAAATAAAVALEVGLPRQAAPHCPSSPRLNAWATEDLHQCAANTAPASQQDVVCLAALSHLPAEGCGVVPGMTRSLSTPSHLSSSSSLAQQQQAGAGSWQPSGGAWAVLAQQQEGEPNLTRATPTSSPQPPAPAARRVLQLAVEPWDALGSSDGGEAPFPAPTLADSCTSDLPAACWVCEGGGSEAGCLACGRTGLWQQALPGAPPCATPARARDLLSDRQW